MADQAQKDLKYVGKVKEMESQYGPFQKIYMENNNPVNADGSENKYYAGTLIFVAPDGSNYKIKQLSLSVPKDGMRPDQAQRGFVKTVTINLNDAYMVEKLS